MNNIKMETHGEMKNVFKNNEVPSFIANAVIKALEEMKKLPDFLKNLVTAKNGREFKNS